MLDKILNMPLQMRQSIQAWIKWILWKTAFKKFQGIWSATLKYFKGCLSQNLLSPLLNVLSQMQVLCWKFSSTAFINLKGIIKKNYLQA